MERCAGPAAIIHLGSPGSPTLEEGRGKSYMELKGDWSVFQGKCEAVLEIRSESRRKQISLVSIIGSFRVQQE